MIKLNFMNLITNKNYQGLSSAKAKEIMEKYGPNIRQAKKQKTWYGRFFKIISEPMIILIIAIATVYFFIGDHFEAFIMICSIISIIIIEFIQETKTDKAIKVLDKMMTQYCTVFRDNQSKQLESKYLVPGDLIFVTAGDKIAADGFILRSSGLQIDESILTGEAISVTKSEIISEITNDNRVFQGTLVNQGEGYIVVEKTGNNTEYGKLGDLLEEIKTLKTPLQKKVHNLVKYIAIVAFLVAASVTLYFSLQSGFTKGLLNGLTIAIALIPEEFPVVFSVFLIMGVWRMTKHKTLIREMTMVEILGSATVICTDKTGTLTEGKMTLKKIYFKNKILTPNEAKKHKKDFLDFIHTSLLSLEQVAIDPIEIEVQRYAKEIGINTQKFFAKHRLVTDSSFDSNTKLVNHIWENNKNECWQYTAGAPESLIKYSNLSNEEKQKIEKVLKENFEKGYRVIAVGKRKMIDCDEITLNNINFVGLIIMSDPPREGVKEAINLCQKAGIRIIMITGDNKLTAHSIAEQINLKHNEEILSGIELEKMSPAELYKSVKHHDIFARVQPEQKYLIVEALQKHGEIVAMTGDGVNDTPALKKANIGIAMGIRGTEVARAASGMVLLDDNFSTIVKAIEEGRRIYDNIRQAFVFLFSFHIPIVGMSLLPLAFGQDLIFMPIHIIFLEMICDPASVLGFEREKAKHDLMLEPPRPTTEPLINPKLWVKIIVQGLAITLISFSFYYYYVIKLQQFEHGSTLAFGSLVISQILIIIFSREWEQIKSNKFLLIISFITLTFSLATIYLAPLRKIFHFTSITFQEFLLIIFIPLIIFSIIKLISWLIKINIKKIQLSK